MLKMQENYYALDPNFSIATARLNKKKLDSTKNVKLVTL